MLSCGSLKRSNNPYIESTVDLVFPRIRKGSSLCGFDWKENPEKSAEAMEKGILEMKAKFLCMCTREKK